MKPQKKFLSGQKEQRCHNSDTSSWLVVGTSPSAWLRSDLNLYVTSHASFNELDKMTVIYIIDLNYIPLTLEQ